MERKGAVTFKGNPVTLVGPELKVGDKAPDFSIINRELKPVSLKDSSGTVRLLSVVTSLDTGICNTQTKVFNDKLAALDGLKRYTISVDLPFAQGRFCGEHHTDNFEFLSDHRDVSFGESYGVLVKELRLLARTIFVVDRNDKIAYIQRMPENAAEPDYDKAYAAINAALKG